MLLHSTLKFLWYFIKQRWIAFSILALTSVMWAINDTIYPYFLKQIVNVLQHYPGPRPEIYSAILSTLIYLVLFWVATELCLRLQGVLQIYTFPQFRAAIRSSVFNYVQSHSHDYFSNHFAGNIAKKIADLPTSCQSILEIILFNFVTAMVGSVIVLIMMWQTRPIFALVLLIWFILHLGFTLIFMRLGNYYWEVHSDASATLSGKIVDVFMNIANVRLFARKQYEMDYLQKFQNDEIAKSKKAMWLVEFSRIGMGLSGLFLIFSMVFLLIHGWVNHWVTLGDFTQVGMQTFWLLGWIWFVSYQINVFVRETGTISNALTLISQGHDIVDAPDASVLKVSHGKIEFSDVVFQYRKNRPVFNHLNVVIPPGQKVGLVGFSGAGKTTFVNLILRFYDIQSGKILIDGQDISKVTQDSLHDSIAMIPQDPSLFHRRLIDNIRYGRLNASYEEVMQASKLAHCHEFIEKLDEGYDSLVGERGIKLSGGQRQRIAIARAILKNAPILILDEATSALDSATEKLIQESLQKLMQNRTTIVIAHRLSTLANMDRILVFEKGKIIEDGTHESLLEAKGCFAKLWAMQTDGFLP